jgi:hypothetical protein
MAKFALKGTRLFTGGVDLTTVNNKIDLKAEIEEKEATAFNPASTTVVWKEVLGGIASTTCSAAGQWEAGDETKVDDGTWAALGGVGALTVFPAGGAVAVGDICYLTKMLTGSYQVGGAIGDVAPWSFEAAGAWPLVRAACLNPPGTARTATGSVLGPQIGATSSAQALYITLHVLSVSGTSTPSLTVAITSDNNSGFSSPAAVGTFTAATAVGSQTMKVAGPITDDYVRAGWTISGTSPSFLFLVAAGIGPA